MLMFWGANAKVGDRSDNRKKRKAATGEALVAALLSHLLLNPDRRDLRIPSGN